MDQRVEDPKTLRGLARDGKWWSCSGTGKVVDLWRLGFDANKKNGGQLVETMLHIEPSMINQNAWAHAECVRRSPFDIATQTYM